MNTTNGNPAKRKQAEDEKKRKKETGNKRISKKRKIQAIIDELRKESKKRKET